METVAEKSERLYGPFVTDENRAYIERLDGPDREYFWAKLYYEVRRQLGKTYLAGIEARVEGTVEPDEPSATPFSDAERSIRAGSYFKKVL